MTDPRPCPSCKTPRKNSRHYLCEGCWWTLPKAARGPLLRRDDQAAARLRQLYRQIEDGVPLHKIEITIR
ncbi:hypothetical protein [Spirillospora sp. CA-128828]|uniref:hypothetical protein n=1 Tax=Spirillospora sp. CA-128828 TaxID=3240033 RepID=UPI003D9441C8